MDIKKKLEDAYIPDQQGRKEKVVIGLSGGLDSFVTAYLLKIQKYELLAVTIVPTWDEVTIDQKNTFSCHIPNMKLDSIKDFCHKLSIPLHILKATSEFKEFVIGPWIADKVMGKKARPCWGCHDLRMKLLLDKMKALKADKIATGHYAKLFRNESNGSVFVHTSNDEANDQSALLSRLNHDILNHLVLPLSDLTKKEVGKLAENFGLTQEETATVTHDCLTITDELIEVLDKKIPKKLIKDGEISNIEGTNSFGQHEGVHRYDMGSPFEFRENGKPIDGVIVGYSYSEKKILVADRSFNKRNKILLVNCHFSEGVSMPGPVKAFAFVSRESVVECWLYPKSLGAVYLELSEEVSIVNGEIISVLKKKGRNSKVLLTGQVRLLPIDPQHVEGEENVQTNHHHFDF